MVINPGSPSRPLDGTDGSCAVLTADENGYRGELVYYSDVKAALAEESKVRHEEAAEKAEESPAPSQSKKKKNFGGFLRKIFNYSDGQ